MAMPTYVLYTTPTPISFSQLQAEYGGSNPISLSEYYLGGAPTSFHTARVPSYYRALVATYNQYSFSAFSKAVYQTDASAPGGRSQEWYSNSLIAEGGGNYTSLSAAQNTTAYSYRRGDFVQAVTTPANSKTGAAAFVTNIYQIIRYENIRTTFSPVNASVPSRGYSQTPPAISMSQFYNTRDYTTL